HGFVVVHGHTIFDEVDERTNRIGIDTGAYRTGVLTALGIEDDSRWYLAAHEDAAPEEPSVVKAPRRDRPASPALASGLPLRTTVPAVPVVPISALPPWMLCPTSPRRRQDNP